jgi:hypothetical protein
MKVWSVAEVVFRYGFTVPAVVSRVENAPDAAVARLGVSENRSVSG